MKDNLNRILSLVFLVLSTASVCFFGIREYYKVKPVISNDIVEVTEAETTGPLESETQSVDLSETLKIEYPDDTKITVRTDKITLKGFCDKDRQLTLNGQAVSLSDYGSFSVEIKLNVGENKLTVSNGAVVYEYIVIYQLPLIKDVNPAADVKAEGSSEIELVAACRRDSTVWAVINGEKVPLYAASVDGNSEFVNYSAKYRLPAASSVDKNLGRVEFNAEYGDNKDAVKGGSIIIKAYKLTDIVIEQGQGTVVSPEITSGDVVNVLTQNTDFGKGKALMYTVSAQYAEAVPANTSDDLNDPRYTPQPKGTIDYITGEFSYDGTEYYKTLSGVKIEKKKVSAQEGYILPSNTITSYKSYTSDGYTNAVLTMNWKVPFYSEMKEQSYYKGYVGRRFNVSAFTASYIDFTFYYTNAAEGGFDFSNSGVVSGAQWINIGNNGTTTLRVTLRNAGRFYGYKAYYSSDNRLVIQFKEKPNASSPLVVLDPGHGGRDCGAIAANGTYEAHLNLRIAAYVKANLEAAGYRVLLTRTSDSFVSKDDRQLMSRNMGGDIFVSIHNNSSDTSATLSGTEVYYYRANSQPLASSIHSQLASSWRETYSDNPEMSRKVVAADGGVRFYPFRVIRNEECPSVLVECGYLSNPVEADMVCNDTVQQRLARAISDGIINYFNNL